MTEKTSLSNEKGGICLNSNMLKDRYFPNDKKRNKLLVGNTEQMTYHKPASSKPTWKTRAKENESTASRSPCYITSNNNELDTDQNNRNDRSSEPMCVAKIEIIVFQKNLSKKCRNFQRQTTNKDRLANMYKRQRVDRIPCTKEECLQHK